MGEQKKNIIRNMVFTPSVFINPDASMMKLSKIIGVNGVQLNWQLENYEHANSSYDSQKVREFLKNARIELSDDEITNFINIWKEIRSNPVLLDVNEIKRKIAELKERHINLQILTNENTANRTFDLLKKAQILDYFDRKITVQNLFLMPTIEGYKDNRFIPTQTEIVSDDIDSVYKAIRMGMYAVFVDRYLNGVSNEELGAEFSEDVEQAKAMIRVISDLSSL